MNWIETENGIQPIGEVNNWSAENWDRIRWYIHLAANKCTEVQVPDKKN